MKSSLSAQLAGIKNEKNAVFVEAVDHGYALIENWLTDKVHAGVKKVGSALERGRDFMMADPAKLPADTMGPDDQRRIQVDEATLDNDLEPYMQALEQLTELVWTYGSRLFNIVAAEPQFRQACAIGQHLDNIRPNPMVEAIAVGQQFAALLESASRLTDRRTATEAGKIFIEANTRAAFPLFEGPGAGYDVTIADTEPTAVNAVYSPDADSFIVELDFAFDGKASGYDWSNGENSRYAGHLKLAIPNKLIPWEDRGAWNGGSVSDELNQKIDDLKYLFQHIKFETVKYGAGWTHVKFDPSRFKKALLGFNFAEDTVTIELADADSRNPELVDISITIDPTFSEDIERAHSSDNIYEEAVAGAHAHSQLDDVIGDSALTSMRHVMQVIGDFIKKHGIYTWSQFTKTDKWRKVYANGGQAVREAGGLV